MLGDRIDTTGLERHEVLSTTPLAFRIEGDSFVVFFRYGVVVLFGMAPQQEDEILRSLEGRVIGLFGRHEEESAQVEIAPDKDEQITPGGTILLKALLPEHVLIIADAIATNLILAHDERNVSAVFDVIEPLARELAEHGRTPGGSPGDFEAHRKCIAGAATCVGSRCGRRKARRTLGAAGFRTILCQARG